MAIIVSMGITNRIYIVSICIFAAALLFYLIDYPVRKYFMKRVKSIVK